ncbi:hypothetical protein PCAR4_1050026 [Paraburkholderia caribensis]|nr:hypothetical protein PCAR4_1050026 [Paraburkholderia caribensis]
MVSYSIYLLHSWILYLISRLVNHFTSIAEMSDCEYWIVGGVVVIVTVAISLLTYRFIEFRFMKPSSRSAEVYERDARIGIFGK